MEVDSAEQRRHLAAYHMAYILFRVLKQRDLITCIHLQVGVESEG